MKFIALFLFFLFVSFQHQIWFNSEGWNNKQNLEQRFKNQQEINQKLRARNDSMKEEIKDLEDGNDAISEVARKKLGYIKKGETYYKVENINP